MTLQIIYATFFLYFRSKFFRVLQPECEPLFFSDRGKETSAHLALNLSHQTYMSSEHGWSLTGPTYIGARDKENKTDVKNTPFPLPCTRYSFFPRCCYSLWRDSFDFPSIPSASCSNELFFNSFWLITDAFGTCPLFYFPTPNTPVVHFPSTPLAQSCSVNK